ncbi:MAG: pyridoxamine 5'-phosphate oxidase [Planctomycetia bacterium]|nr:pyridoxamine 5'-phosphate oxidase [Planctomycetia bacterium]
MAIVDAMYAEAVQRFGELFQRASQAALREPAAVTLATADVSGRPSARVVLLRRYDAGGFVFFTNSQSRKGEELAANPRAALCFYWDPLLEQVRIEGTVEQVTAAESDDYWHSRPRDSQLGAWASDQSQTLDRRETLERRAAEFAEKFEGQRVPRPEHWLGYRVVPLRIEFWRSRPARLHERVAYEKGPGGWTKTLLYP